MTVKIEQTVRLTLFLKLGPRQRLRDPESSLSFARTKRLKAIQSVVQKMGGVSKFEWVNSFDTLETIDDGE